MSASAPRPASSPARWRRHLGPGLLAVLVGLWAIGQVARDACWLTGLCFYIPSPVLVFVLITGGVLLWRGKRKRAAHICFVATLAPVLLVVLAENQWTAPVPTPAATPFCRIVHWNVFRGYAGEDALVNVLRPLAADIYVLSETPYDMDMQNLAARIDGRLQRLRLSNMTVLARGVVDGRAIRRLGRARACPFVWTYQGRRLRLLIVDLPSSLWLHRQPLLEWVNTCVEEIQPDLVLGDFNAPRRSWALSSPPPGYSHAYDKAGCGWSYTWPAPCPVLAIDQCLVRSPVQPVAYDVRLAWGSDHCLQVLDFTSPDVITPNQ